jgi:hypothetical protein
VVDQANTNIIWYNHMSARKKDTESSSDDDTTGKVLNILTNGGEFSRAMRFVGKFFI